MQTPWILTSTRTCQTPKLYMQKSHMQEDVKLFSIPKTSTSIQKRHPYTGNLNAQTSGDRKNAFLHRGDVLEPLNRNS